LRDVIVIVAAPHDDLLRRFVSDTGAWDALGDQGKADYFAGISARSAARRIGTPDDIANGVLFAMTNTFLTGQTLHIDGGEPFT
jgi:NAD(P)-dependent dehydrogenase (short-subunit alcohol dehydrogenase family)